MLAVLAIFVSWFFPARMAEMAARLERTRATSVASALEKAAASALGFNDELAVNELLLGVSKDPDARFAQVLRVDGTTLAAWNVDKTRKLPPLKGEMQQWIDGDTLVVATPINSVLGSRGHLILGMSRQALRDELRAIRETALWASLIILALGAVLSWALGSWLVRPTLVLTALTAKVLRDNDLRVEIPTLSRDEIGALGGAFKELLAAQRGTLASLQYSLDEHEQLGLTLGRVAARVQQNTDTIDRQVTLSLTVSSKMLSEIEDVAGEIRKLTNEVTSTTDSAAQMTRLLEGVAQKLHTLGNDVQRSSKELDDMVMTIEQTARAIGEVDAALRESTIAMHDMEASQDRVRAAVGDAQRASNAVNVHAEAGVASIEKTVASLTDIHGTAGDAAAAIAALNGRVEEVGEFLSVIEDVADRTNLLSLNASIIAAQAGEHGRAFSVVADEINDLATRSREYTQQIAATIGAIRNESKRAAEATARSQTRVELGVERGQEAAEVFARIRSGTNDALAASGRIGKESEEQLGQARTLKRLLDQLSNTFEALRTAGQQQSSGAGIIANGAKQMLALTSQALAAAEGQNEAIRTIERGVAKVSEVTGTLKTAQDAQREQGKNVRSAIDAISSAAASQREAIRSLEQSMNALAAQTATLREGMQRFMY